jgi:hypothetical protein
MFVITLFQISWPRMKEDNMLLMFALFMVIKHVVVALLAFQQIVIYVQNVEMMVMVFLKEAK